MPTAPVLPTQLKGDRAPTNGVRPVIDAPAPGNGAGNALASHPATPRSHTALNLTAYGLIIASIYAVIGPLFFMGAKEKIFYAAPAGIHKMFAGTFVSSFPGTGPAWFLIGLLEAAVVVGLVVSLARGEFLPSREKPWLLATIALSMLAYAAVAFGDTITGTFAGTASLYTYFATTGVLVVLVLLMPPYRPTNWLSSITGNR